MMSYIMLFAMSAILVTGFPNHVHQDHTTPSDKMDTISKKQAEMMEEQKVMVLTTCVNKTGATPEELKKLRSMDFEDTDNKTKCFIHCTLQMMELVDKDDVLHFEKMLKLADKAGPPPVAAEMKKLVEMCRHKVSAEENEGSEGCDVTYQFIKCIAMKNKEFFLMLFP